MAEKKYNAPAADGVLEVMEFMADNSGAWGPTELSRETGLGLNLIFRILNVLTEHGYASRNASGKYELGAKLFSLGMKLHSRFSLSAMARPCLQLLAEQTGETTQLQVPDGDRMLLTDCVHPPRDYYLAVNPGTRLYYHGNAFGKAVLAFLSEEAQNGILHSKLCRMTSETVVSLPALRKELAGIRETFVATEFEEYLSGGYCIGSPVFDATGKVVAGLGVSGLTSRKNPLDVDNISTLVRQCAEEVTRKIGGIKP